MTVSTAQNTTAITRVARWARKNLFASPLDTILSLGCLALLIMLLPPLLKWAVLDANFSGETREACTGGGACWVFVRVRLHQFFYGFYPENEIWRVHVGFFALLLSLVPMFKQKFRHRGLWLPLGLVLSSGFSWALLKGGIFGLSDVETPLWGGLMLTMLISYAGIVVSLPLGILLALGRRSKLKLISALSTGFIEIWRGVPLVTVLFMASVMLPLFMPEGVDVDKLLRALIGVSLFSSAYMAEVVRGGLQAIPKGQIEAASALGLHYTQTMALIVLPQALKKVIPGIVNTFISLFKDTTLVLIIGMFDLLGMVQSAISDSNWLGLASEAYVFSALVYWVCCFSMSRYSQSLERSLSRD